jgi:hypothetical protein
LLFLPIKPLPVLWFFDTLVLDKYLPVVYYTN